MAQLKKIAEPFGEVNVYPGPGVQRVVATILMEPHKEGCQTGIALDGSGSMSQLYGASTGGALSSVFGRKEATNQITPVAQKVCAYLARKLDADGGTTVIYWAVGQAGGKVEVVGDFTAEQAEKHYFAAPRAFGTGTQLLPAVKYFEERFRDAPYGFYAFITDGELHDLEDVKSYTAKLARDIAARRRNPLKFVLIGVGSSVNEAQMEELDDLETGTNVDLWDHKLASELTRLEQIFAEVIEENARVADRGKIVDPSGRTLIDYSDTGVPAKLQFEVPLGVPYFTLEVNGQKIHQGLSDTAMVPASMTPPSQAIPSAIPVAQAVPPPLPPTAPAAPPARKHGHNLNELDEVLPAVPVDVDPVPGTEPAKKDDDWLGFDLKFDKDKQPDVDLKKDDGK